jgi:hypothetical protein
MKILINLIIIIGIGLLIKWNFSSDPQTADLLPIESSPIDNPNVEETFEKEDSSKRLLAIHYLIKNKLLKNIDFKVAFTQSEDEQTFIDDFTLTNSQEKIYYHFEINKEEAFYRAEKNLYSYDVLVLYNDEVVLQFNGHLDRNLTPPEFIDLDVVAYRPGKWENFIKKVELGQ